jgi:hypothetical protein
MAATTIAGALANAGAVNDSLTRVTHLCASFRALRFNDCQLRDHRDMTALLDHLDELDGLVRAARKNGMQPERFISEFRDAIGKVSALLPIKTNGFLDADYILTEIIAAYEKHPTLRGVGKIGNALVGYRRTAIS